MDYSNVTSGVVQRGEELFPFRSLGMAPDRVDWVGIRKWLERNPVVFCEDW